MRVSVDVGGTFTDVIVLDDAGHLRLEKVQTVPANPASGVLSGFQKAEATPQEIDYFVHGTTLGINALLTRTGAKVAIVTTLGFRDVYDLARTDRDPMYDFKYQKPQSLVPRYLIFEVDERLDFQGDVLTPFDRESAVAAAQRIQAEAVDAVAVCFLHAYANPTHELAMAAVLNEICPNVSVTLSHHLSREYREYERTSTTVIDAYVKPITRTYLQKLNGNLRDQGLAGQFLMTRSGGGAMTVASAQEQPVHLVLSGPAGGVIGAGFLSDLIGYKNLITIDMGGTSLDASLVVDGKPKIENEQDFQGLPMSIPTIDIHTIGAGGGSMAWIDDGDHLQVGPKSAGASPGPVCYDKGGTQPTFTDAALVVGYLDPANFLGGEITLNMTKAEEALNALASRLSTTGDDVAAGILRISEAKIAGAVREISIEQGHHPARFCHARLWGRRCLCGRGRSPRSGDSHGDCAAGASQFLGLWHVDGRRSPRFCPDLCDLDGRLGRSAGQSALCYIACRGAGSVRDGWLCRGSALLYAFGRAALRRAGACSDGAAGRPHV